MTSQAVDVADPEAAALFTELMMEYAGGMDATITDYAAQDTATEGKRTTGVADEDGLVITWLSPEFSE